MSILSIVYIERKLFGHIESARFRGLERATLREQAWLFVLHTLVYRVWSEHNHQEQ